MEFQEIYSDDSSYHSIVIMYMVVKTFIQIVVIVMTEAS